MENIRKWVTISLAVFWLFLMQAAPSRAASWVWWERHDEGWFFYNEPPPPEPEEVLPPEGETPVQPATVKPPALEMPQKSEPGPLWSERMERKGKELLSRAIENPTLENVTAYAEHNKRMIEASDKFARMWQLAKMMHPELEAPGPGTEADKDIFFKVQREIEHEKLEELSREAGLFFFFSGSCPYCKRQAVRLRSFLKEHPSFVVKAVSLDGGILEEFPEADLDNGISKRLGVESVPAIFLAFPPDRFERISSGILATGELERRLLYYVEENQGPVAYGGAADFAAGSE